MNERDDATDHAGAGDALDHTVPARDASAHHVENGLRPIIRRTSRAVPAGSVAMSTTDVPRRPGLVGWFGTLLALLWLLEPASFRRPTLAATALPFARWRFGVYRHPSATDPPAPWRRSLD